MTISPMSGRQIAADHAVAQLPGHAVFRQLGDDRASPTPRCRRAGTGDLDDPVIAVAGPHALGQTAFRIEDPGSGASWPADPN